MRIYWRSTSVSLGFKGDSNLCHCHVRGPGPGEVETLIHWDGRSRQGTKGNDQTGPSASLLPCSSFCTSSLPAMVGVEQECSTWPFPWLALPLTVFLAQMWTWGKLFPKIQGFCNGVCDPFVVGLPSQGHKRLRPLKFLKKLPLTGAEDPAVLCPIKEEGVVKNDPFSVSNRCITDWFQIKFPG